MSPSTPPWSWPSTTCLSYTRSRIELPRSVPDRSWSREPRKKCSPRQTFNACSYEAFAMFEIEDLHAYYGKSHVVQGVSLQVQPGEAVGLVGRNGVGKTTTLKSIMGMVRHTEGRITLSGQDMTRLAAHTRARRGFGYVPEERAVFR